MSKITPGKWEAVAYQWPNAQRVAFTITGNRKGMSASVVADVPCGPNGEMPRHAEANAALIAAAPELLAAAKAAYQAMLRMPIDWHKASDATDGILDALRAAIAQAEGEV